MEKRIYYNQLTKETANLLLKDKNIEIIGNYVNSNTTTTFKCNVCGNEFESKYNYVRLWTKSGCKKCNNRVLDTELERTNMKIDKMNKKKSPNLKIINVDKDKVNCECLICHQQFIMSYSSIMRGSFHKPCAMKESAKRQCLTPNQIVQKMQELGKDITVNFENYIDGHSIVHCQCNVCNYEWTTQARNLTRDRQCPNCARIKRNNSKKLPIERYQYLLDKYELKLIGNFDSGSAKSLVQCKICNSTFETSMTYLENFGIGCTKCNEEHRSKIKYENFLVNLSKSNSHIELKSEFTNMSDKCVFYCIDCKKEFIKTPHDFLKTPFCPCCNTNSNLEVAVKHYLDDNNIDFEIHKSFVNLVGINGGLLSYDFYLPNHNILIECQGEQHERPIEYFGGKEQFIVQQEHDRRKRKYAEDKNIKLLDIWYYDLSNVNQILTNVLN